MQVAERARQLRVVNGRIKPNKHGPNRGIRWYFSRRKECVICRILKKKANEIRVEMMMDEVTLTVPPMKEIPSLRSSSSSPDMPITYTLLSLGNLSTEER